VNQPGLFGNRPLHVAAIRWRHEEIAALLDGRPDVNIVGPKGQCVASRGGQSRPCDAVADIVLALKTGLWALKADTESSKPESRQKRSRAESEGVRKAVVPLGLRGKATDRGLQGAAPA